MGWLLAGGALLIIFVLKNSGRTSSGQAQGARREASASSSSPIAATVPAPAPSSSEFTVLAPTSILAPADPQPGSNVVLNPGNIPAELYAVMSAGGAASDQDLERAAARARQLNRFDLGTYFDGLLQHRQDAARTFQTVSEDDANTVDSVVQTEPDHDAATGVPVERLAMEEVEVPSSRTPRGDRTVQQRVQTTELPRARADRGQLHTLALRVADNLRRTGRRAYDRALVTSFQRGAGLAADGDYGNRTRQALGYYGQIPASQLPASQY